MAKTIQGEQIIEDNHLANAIDQGEKLIAVYKELDAVVIKFATDTKKAAKATGTETAEGIQKITKALSASNEAKNASIQIDNQIIKAEAKLKSLDTERARSLAKTNLEIQRQNKANKEAAILASKTSTEYEKQSVKLNQLRIRLKHLVLTEGEGSKATQKLRRSVQQLDRRLKRADATAGQFQRSVGNYGRAVARVGSIMKGFGATMLAAFSITAIRSFVSGSIEAFRVQEKAVAKVEQAIKSTGGAARRTGEQLQKMASDLQQNTLFGDEQILNQVTAQLLTFTNIAGTQFDRTQKVALDLATVLDGDLKSASIQLGKALNDPVANLSALSRSGIQFSTEQKKTIKSLVETNRLADAQNVILTELERQYGGQAEAAAKVDGGVTQMSNAFGDFKEVVGKVIIGGLKPIIKSLKEFFANVKEEDVKNFISQIKLFGKALFSLLAITKTYSISIAVAAKAQKLFGNSLIKNTKAAGPWGVALGLVVVAVISLWKELTKADLATEKLNKRTEAINENLDKEVVKLDGVRRKLLKTTPASKERGDVLKEINETYGTTLTNLKDEAEFLDQVAEAYRNVTAEIRNRISTEVITQELIDLNLELRKVRREQRKVGEGGVVYNVLNDAIVDLRTEISKSEKDLAALESQQDSFGQSAERSEKTVSDQTNALDAMAESAKKAGKEIDKLSKKLDQSAIEEELRFKSLQQREKDKQDQIKENIKILADAEEERQKEIERQFAELEKSDKARRDREKKAEAERLARLKKFRDESLDIIKSITDGIAKEIDKRNELLQSEIKDRQDEISRLEAERRAGSADAAIAVKAEKVAIAKAKLEIESLEKKKRNLLIVTTALEKASQNIGSGDPNPFASASASIQDFLSKLPKFYTGTPGTIGEALGKTGTRDGHIIRADDNEMILNKKKVDSLRASGLSTTDQITQAAMAHQNNALSGRAMKASIPSVLNIDKLIDKQDSIIEAVKDIKIVHSHTDPITGRETVIDGKTVTIIDHKPKKIVI